MQRLGILGIGSTNLSARIFDLEIHWSDGNSKVKVLKVLMEDLWKMIILMILMGQ